MDSDSIHHMSTIPRITVSPPLMLELLHVVYHAVEREACGGLQALNDIIQRATYETYAGTVCVVSTLEFLLFFLLFQMFYWQRMLLII